MASLDISPELVGVLHALKEKIDATKRQYDLMMEMREVIAVEYDLMFKQQDELRLEIIAQIEKMATMRDSMKKLKQETEENRKRFQAEKDEAEAILITESLKKLDAINKQKKAHKPHTLFSNIFPIGTLGTTRK
jgi:hypothetical protein